MAKSLDALLEGLQKADGGISMSVAEYKEAQYGLPLPHYCLQYLFGSTGLRYGGFYMLAGKPKVCKSPFGFWLAKNCCNNNGVSFVYDLENKLSPTLIYSMLADNPELLEANSPFKLITKVMEDKEMRNLTLDLAEKHLTKSVLKTFKKLGAYDTPLFIDWDSVSGSGMSDVTEKIESEGTASKGYYDKPHVMKHFTENWASLIGNLPVIFVGVLQEKEKAASTPGLMAMPQKSYGGGDSQIFKAGTLLSFKMLGKADNFKRVRITTELNGFADSRSIETKFMWDQFGALESESQGHHWTFADTTAQCLANPKVVGDLRDIIDVKYSDKGLVSCKQFGLDKVYPEEFEAALFAEENKKTLEDLYRYQKIEKIKTPEEYIEYVSNLTNKADLAKQAEKDAKAREKEAKEAAEKAKLEEKQAKKEAKVKKNQLASEMLKKLQEKQNAIKEGTANGDRQEPTT